MHSGHCALDQTSKTGLWITPPLARYDTRSSFHMQGGLHPFDEQHSTHVPRARGAGRRCWCPHGGAWGCAVIILTSLGFSEAEAHRMRSLQHTFAHTSCGKVLDDETSSPSPRHAGCCKMGLDWSSSTCMKRRKSLEGEDPSLWADALQNQRNGWECTTGSIGGACGAPPSERPLPRGWSQMSQRARADRD